MALVLLVEDDFAIREAVAESLSEAGLAVVSASDGRDALRYLEDARSAGRPMPSLVITDLAMPHIGGCALIDRLRAMPELRPVPIVVLTALPRVPDLCSATAVLRKPIENWESVLAMLIRLASSAEQDPGCELEMTADERITQELRPRPSDDEDHRVRVRESGAA